MAITCEMVDGPKHGERFDREDAPDVLEIEYESPEGEEYVLRYLRFAHDAAGRVFYQFEE